MKTTKLSAIHVLGIALYGRKLIVGLWWRQLEFDVASIKFFMVGVIKDPFGVSVGLGTKSFNFNKKNAFNQTHERDA